jgi:hypothetical protein
MKKLITLFLITSGINSYAQSYEGNYIKSTTSGGTPPYTFNLDGGPYQTNDTIIVTTTGAHTLGVKDALGCTKFMPFTMYGTLSISLVSKTSTSLTVSAAGGKSPYYFSKNSTTSYTLNKTTWTGLRRGNTYVMRVKDSLNYISIITIVL